MKKLMVLTITLSMAALLPQAVKAQNNPTHLNAPVNIGTYVSSGNVHIYQPTATEIGELPSDDGLRDTISSLDAYINILHMTNPTTGTNNTDGFAITQYNKEVTIQQYETENLHIFGSGGTGLTIGTTGHVGIGSVPQSSYRLNVGGNTRVDGGFLATGNITAFNASLSGSLTVTGSATIGNGFYCSNDGHLRTKEVRVTLSGWSDFVFDDGYQLPTLAELERYVTANRHLPGIPTAKEVEEGGVDLGEMNALLLQKIEELTLYIIDLQKQIDELKQPQK